ncbi:hexosaminidase [Lentzea albidocapillata subsp. violacea]|uniref:beta-N-acetylhexosaminidase n=1 Tax=Lentzea albidocapillata subsp. violacea TaxID=128104 RepID=A0A1G9NM55_9PSEU|nr:beta-N-acetylhexosaminidase [Lentzea albidocapillata]SDL87431.1 hexosaminidase [Lentzea albidocapillata subsp. violacea]
MKATRLQAALAALVIAGSGVLVTNTAEAAAPTTLQELVPQPVRVQPRPDITYTLTPAARIQVASQDARKPAELLARILRPSTGYPLPITDSVSGEGVVLTGGADLKTGPEGYQLDVTPKQVVIRANSPAGHFNGIATLRQLLPPKAEAKTRQPGPWTVPGASILDHPRYHHRGAMLDVSRHFFTPDQVKRYLDQIAAFKINYFHLHLSDDQGWRLEIKSWPELTRIGGSTEVGGRTGKLFYTQDQYRDIVAFAASRGITVIPEFDMPGHTNAAQASYAELNCDGRKRPLYTGIEVGFSSLCITKDITYRFVEDVVREVSAITPGPYFHIGGDEALSTPDADYVTFMSRVLPIVKKYGKTTVGWHEFIKTTKDTAVVPQFWGTKTTDANVAAAAQRGNKILMSPANRIYLDMKYDKNTKLGLDWAGLVEVRDAYSWNPGAYLDGVTEANVRGVEAPLWTETIRTSADIEYMAFPRLPVAAELGWSPAAVHNWDRFAPRLGAQGPRWKVQGVNFYASTQVPWKK